MKKRWLSFGLCTIISLTLLTGCKGPSLPLSSSTETRKFENYLDNVFKNEVCSNTLNLHFTLSNPEEYGIENYKLTLGDLSKHSRDKGKALLYDTQKELKGFHKLLLSKSDKFNYELLTNYVNSQISLCDYDLYGDVLSPSNGLQSQLPMLFAEYKFRSNNDIADYLKLLKLMDSYYEEVVSFEKEKAQAGLFMSDTLCLKVIKECEEFIKDPDNNYLLSTFDNKINELNFLSEKEKTSYIEDNRKAIKDHVIPAYQTLIQGLSSLLGSGENDEGLCYFDKGKDYYQLLVQTETGCDDSMKKLAQRIEDKRKSDLELCGYIKGEHPNIASECENIDWPYDNEEAMISTLQKELLKEFPAMKDTSYDIHYVDEALADSLAPAFYITAPIDDYSDNTIYINSAKTYEDIVYFATLAHEGFPGHLYQTVMSYDYGMEPFRCLLNYNGFTEGWATYVEMLSYYYAGLDTDLASFLQHSEAATFSLYASSDIGIHYLGWDRKQLYEFWGKYGITDEDSIDQIRELILADPGNYLQYYVGYLEFDQLRQEKEKKYGKKFDPVKFHEAILKIGPAPFDLIDKYFDYYY